MQTDFSLSAGDNTLPPLSWQFDLYKKVFHCDPQLPVFLGYEKNSKLTIQQLFDAFHYSQPIEVKDILKRSMVSGDFDISPVIIKKKAERYLAALSFHYQGSETGIIEGKIQFSQRLLSKDQENQLFRVLFDNAQSGLIITDTNHNILIVNDYFCTETGYAKDELIGKNSNTLRSDRYTNEFYQNLWSYVDNKHFWSGELLMNGKLKNASAYKVQIQKIKLPDSSYVYTITGSKLEISVELFREQAFAKNGHFKLPNRKELSDKLEQVYQQLSDDKTIVLAAFNVTSMQSTSIETIQWLIAQRFNSSSLGGQLGLINDNIFGAFWITQKNADKINILLNKVLKEIAGGDEVDLNLGLTYTITMGVSVLAIDAYSQEQLLTHSVQSLTASPNRSESSIIYFAPSLVKRFNRKGILTGLLKKALATQTIEVNYQPIIELSTMRIQKFKALFRILLDTELDYDIKELIVIAEENEWIEHIDRMVTKMAIKALPIIQKHYQASSIGMTITRSLASETIKYSSLEDSLKILQATDIDSTKICIELSNAGISSDMEKQKFWIEKIKENGSEISIGDFTTGYASFSYLNKLPINSIKIDRAMIANLTLSSTEYTIIEMLCKLAHTLGIKVIASGVETREQLTLLSRAKVDMVQGYLFNKPLSLEKLTESSARTYNEFSRYLYQENVITAKDIMQRDFLRIGLDHKMDHAKQMLANSKLSYLVVIDKRKCYGILQSVDIEATISPYIGSKSEQTRDLMTLQKRAHQVMNKEFTSLHFSCPIAKIKDIFAENENAIVIITGDSGNCVGVITIHELFNHISKFEFTANGKNI